MYKNKIRCVGVAFFPSAKAHQHSHKHRDMLTAGFSNVIFYFCFDCDFELVTANWCELLTADSV